MVTFLQETLAFVIADNTDISNITFILPSKRAGSSLLNELKKQSTETRFAPEILSIEEFVEQLSNLSIIDPTELLFKSYEAYLNTSSIKEKETFEDYATWSITLLNDFNEIDRYMVPADHFFEYLANIKSMERWGVEKDTSTLVSNYIQFWTSLPEFYNTLKISLRKEHLGFQGMVYREAATNITSYVKKYPNKKHVFIGFNALNTAEQQIIQTLIAIGNNKIYWDIDQYFIDDQYHITSLFVRKYLKEWNYYSDQDIPIFPKNFSSEKDFRIVEVQKNIGQAKYVGELLSSFSQEQLKKTAIVLGDEKLLVPILNSLPKNVENINVTMGMSLKNFPASTFFELLFHLQMRSGENLYYKDILSILNHPLGASIVPAASKIVYRINVDNITHLSPSALKKISNEMETESHSWLFDSWRDSGATALENALKILDYLEGEIQENKIESLVLSKLSEIFKTIQALSEKYPHLNSIKTVLSLFTQIVETTTLDFEGDAFEGLQVMGVLETRVLDFETVIITSVNEGIFPSGKSNSSFITFDLKQQFHLPLYTEKDAIYTYHFYRLLQRARNITLLYSGHSEGMNSGEKSRFISQLEIDKNPNHTIEKKIISPSIHLGIALPKKIEKTEKILMRLEEIAKKGFSPSALTSYIRNPLDFYFQRILGIREAEEVEENVAANTLGTIVHDSLETFYKPLEGSVLTKDLLNEMIGRIHEEVTRQFQKTFKGGVFNRGKNFIVFEVAKRYMSNFLYREMAEVNAGNEIKIMKIETPLTVDIPIPELGLPVKLRGIVDRMDLYNGRLRIIDYKTGKVEPGEIAVKEWESISTEYKYSKAFQVLAYTLMLSNEVSLDDLEAGIISFKNQGRGFMSFSNNTGSKGSPKNITQEVMDNFTTEIKRLILEIFDPAIPFIEKEV